MTSVGIPHEWFCTLCGVSFRSHDIFTDYKREHDDDIAWTSYFIALRTPEGMTKNMASGPDSKWYLSGVGQQDIQVPRIPPPGYDIRDVLKGRRPEASQYKVRYMMNAIESEEWKSFEHTYRFGYSNELRYCMHPRCWDILLQQHALIAPPTKTLDLNELGRLFVQIPLKRAGSCFRPDWTTDFTGPERFAGIEDDILGIRIPPVCNFVFRDPGTPYGFDELLANPPLEPAANTSPRIQFTDHGDDIFSRLPEELLTKILVLLPSASVRDVQLASKKMASVHLSSRYWRSRFDFPNELCHVKLPPALLKSGRVGERWVDWRRLCDQLLHPVGDEFEWWQNRKRIIALNRKLVRSMPLRRSDGRLRSVEDVSSVQ